MESVEETDDKNESISHNSPESISEDATEENEEGQQDFKQLDHEADDALRLSKEDMPETEPPIEGEGGTEEVHDEEEEYDESEGEGDQGEEDEGEGGEEKKPHPVQDKHHKADESLEPRQRTDSIIISKTRLTYDVTPRHADVDIFQFPTEEVSVINLQPQKSKYYSYMNQNQEEEDEADSIILEKQVPKIDRTPYYNRHKILEPIIFVLKIRNGVLQKKLAIYFRRRKMEQVLTESDQVYDSQQRYNRKLDNLAEMLETDKNQRTTVNNELTEFRLKKEAKQDQLIKMFQDMQNREKDIGTGLIYTKTGNEIPEKLVERLIRRQKTEMNTVCELRLKYIILREMTAGKQQAIADLDNVGAGLHLVDYEQLKSENRSFADKIEEKEEELTRLRAKCQNTTQILAHIREKSAALDVDIDDLNDELHVQNKIHFQTREKLNELKTQRDHYRSKINKLRNESGLLTEPNLLMDMEKSIEELKLASTELEQLQQEYKIKNQQLRNIRRNIEIVSDETYRKIKSDRKLSTIKQSASGIFKGKTNMATQKPSKIEFKASKHAI